MQHARRRKRLTYVSGTTEAELRYSAFGNTTEETGATETPYKWIGQQGYRSDEATSLYNLRARDYDPATGQFTSQDPLGLVAGDSNFYRYVGNNAPNQTDPSGLGEFATGGAGLYYVTSGGWFGWGSTQSLLGQLVPGTNQVRRYIDLGGGFSEEYCADRTRLQALLQNPGSTVLDQWTEIEWDDWFELNGQLCGRHSPPPLPTPREQGVGGADEQSLLPATIPGTQSCKPLTAGSMPTICGDGESCETQFREVGSAIGELAQYVVAGVALQYGTLGMGQAISFGVKICGKVAKFTIRVGGKVIEVGAGQIRTIIQRLRRRARGGNKEAKALADSLEKPLKEYQCQGGEFLDDQHSNRFTDPEPPNRASRSRRRSARGLQGADLEEWIVENLGGTGGFSSGGRQIDGILPDGTWYEAKSAFNYLFNLDGTLNLQAWNEFTSQITFAAAEAARNGARFKLLTNVTPPLRVISWLERRGISWELLE